MVDFVCYGSGDARALDLYDFARGPALFFDQTATSFKVAYGDGNVTEFEGYGFSYDPSTGAPISGTTTYGLRSVNGEPFGLITGISITMEQAAAYIAMNDPQAVNRDVFKGNDRITGSVFDDYLDGWGGADRLYGGAGNDTYIIDNVGDRVIEAANNGIDTIQSSVSYTLSANVEKIVLTGSGSINATGNDAANTLTGNAGANLLDGGAGADTMIGGAGSDTYYVDNISDRAVETNGAVGTDLVVASVSFSLGGSELENLTLTGTANINGTGNSIANVLTGNAGANILNGLGGADRMIGGSGSDTYYVDNAGDKAVETNGAVGTDLVVASVSYSLGGSELENLTLTGSGSLNGTGNSIANVLTGNAGANILNGLGGSDTLAGLGGSDTFVFSTALAATNVDRLSDFSATDDTMQLSRSVFSVLAAGSLDAAAFKDLSVSGATVDADDRILYDKATGALSYDADGNGSKAAVQFAVLDNKAALTAADFFVV
ncbi:hypothetical protein ASG52_05450 [Methylobacterium sp. Leaf456]|uniref:calcium-binding protein n=1 Tax=Methylobacterium sp. Leaf456 TaxID=1736382 RepID=UPI0007004332|nr:calcium-binding protein [Methylobacterium sp. Leaf456]KQT53562.1 hypothetical protein ASG52_05450 [Methylobacterium sp. Leaf456]